MSPNTNMNPNNIHVFPGDFPSISSFFLDLCVKEGTVIAVVDIECLDLLKSHRHQKHQSSRSCKSYHSLQLSSISGRVFQHGWQFGCKPFHATGAVLSQSTAFVNSTKAWTWSRPSPSAWSDASMVAQALVIFFVTGPVPQAPLGPPQPEEARILHPQAQHLKVDAHRYLEGILMPRLITVLWVQIPWQVLFLSSQFWWIMGNINTDSANPRIVWFSKQKPSFIVDFPTSIMDVPTFIMDFPTFIMDFPRHFPIQTPSKRLNHSFPPPSASNLRLQRHHRRHHRRDLGPPARNAWPGVETRPLGTHFSMKIMMEMMEDMIFHFNLELILMENGGNDGK